jgi:hypothetical protein
MPLTKKAHEKSELFSHPRAKFNGRQELPGWPGKDGAAQTMARCGF